jgi:hypothetical protein
MFDRGRAVGRNTPAPVAGELSIAYLGSVPRAVLIENPAMPNHVVPDLLHPVLISAGKGRMRLRGFEDSNGVMYGQDWLCEIVYS